MTAGASAAAFCAVSRPELGLACGSFHSPTSGRRTSVNKADTSSPSGFRLSVLLDSACTQPPSKDSKPDMALRPHSAPPFVHDNSMRYPSCHVCLPAAPRVRRCLCWRPAQSLAHPGAWLRSPCALAFSPGFHELLLFETYWPDSHHVGCQIPMSSSDLTSLRVNIYSSLLLLMS